MMIPIVYEVFDLTQSEEKLKLLDGFSHPIIPMGQESPTNLRRRDHGPGTYH